MQTEQRGNVKTYPNLKGLVVEFWPDRLAKVAPTLGELGYSFTHAASWEQFLNLHHVLYPDLAVLANTVSSNKPKHFDLDLQAAKVLHEENPGCKTLFVINNSFDIDTCTQAIDLGVCGFINFQEKDFKDLLVEQIEQIRQRQGPGRDAKRICQCPQDPGYNGHCDAVGGHVQTDRTGQQGGHCL